MICFERRFSELSKRKIPCLQRRTPKLSGFSERTDIVEERNVDDGPKTNIMCPTE